MTARDVHEEFDDDEARRRIARRRARHDRALEKKTSIRILLKKGCDDDERGDDDEDDGDEDDGDEDAGRAKTRPSREMAERLRRDDDAYRRIEVEATRALQTRSEETRRGETPSAISRAREEERRERVREQRHEFRRDMIDDAEASGDVNDELVERWNEMLREDAGARRRDDEDVDDRVDCIELHERFQAHVMKCRRALEPKESLIRRLQAHLIAEVDVRYDAQMREHREELDRASREAMERGDAHERLASDTVRAARVECAEMQGRRDASRAEALTMTDVAVENEVATRLVGARRDDDERRAMLISMELENAREIRDLRENLENRLGELLSRLHAASASKPLLAERLQDAVRRRRLDNPRRRSRERAGHRLLKALRIEMFDLKRQFTVMEASNERIDARLRRETEKTRQRLEIQESRDGFGGAEDATTRALASLKRARIDRLTRELDAVEEKIWFDVLRHEKPSCAEIPLAVRSRAYEQLTLAIQRRPELRARARARV